MAKLIFGCGYLGARVARRWREVGEEVTVVTRDSRRAHQFEQQGLRVLVADVLQPATLTTLPVADCVLYAIGYDRRSGATMHEVYVTGLQNVLAALPAETGKLIYVSSTGVYGQSQGEWVDEDSPAVPTREGGRTVLAAEAALLTHPLGRRAIVLRMAGLYGPGRIPSLADVSQNRPIAAPSEGFLNLIHVDDAAGVVLAADQQAAVPRTYAVSDGVPVVRRDYYQEIARLIGSPPPRFAPPPADLPATARAGSDKRIKNTRMLWELGVRLAYPSYREGLAAIVAAENRAENERG